MDNKNFMHVIKFSILPDSGLYVIFYSENMRKID